MTLETREWTPEDHVRDAADVSAMLCAGLETGEIEDIRFALRTISKSQGLAKVAARSGVSRQALHNILEGETDPKLSTVLNLFAALGLTLMARPNDVPEAA